MVAWTEEQIDTLQGWIEEAKKASLELRRWLLFLQVILHYGPVDDDTFMEHVQNLVGAGLLSFVDESALDIDRLREMVTVDMGEVEG